MKIINVFNSLIRKNFKLLFSLALVLVIIFSAHSVFTKLNLNPSYKVGDVIDHLNGVAVYHNGGFAHVEGRNLTADGYNLGLKYQCVEFVKRYYYEHYQHKMPDSYGHAKNFFNSALADGELNPQRGLLQYKNGGFTAPKKGDLLVYSPTLLNRFGHVAIVSNVDSDQIEVIQQNSGPFGKSREVFSLSQNEQGKWLIDNKRIVGFLRKP